MTICEQDQKERTHSAWILGKVPAPALHLDASSCGSPTPHSALRVSFGWSAFLKVPMLYVH